MKLPRRGAFIDPETGSILWMWTHNDPATDFDVLPPLLMPDGGGEPTSTLPLNAVLVNLEAMDAQDLDLLHANPQTICIRVDPDQTLRFCERLEYEDGTIEEMDHEVAAQITARAALRSRLAARAIQGKRLNRRGRQVIQPGTPHANPGQRSST